jgi:hypothetical protein
VSTPTNGSVTISGTGTPPVQVNVSGNQSLKLVSVTENDPSLGFKRWTLADLTTPVANDACLSGQGATHNLVAHFNRAPIANPQPEVTTDEDTSKLITLSAIDPENDPLTYKIISLPTNGKLYKGNSTAAADEIKSADLPFTLPGSGNQVTYKPNDNYNGGDSFAFRANDGTSDSINIAPVPIKVNPVNDAPVNSVPGNQSTNEDTALTFKSANSNLISISDVDAGSNAVKVTLGVTHGKLTLSGISGLNFTAGSNGTANMTFTGTIANVNTALSDLKFDPDANYNGSAALTITTDDQGNTGNGGAKTDSDSVNITVNAVNDAPDAVNDTATTDEDTPTNIDVKANDTDVDQGDTLTITNVTDPAHGNSGTDTANVSITVRPVNDPPEATDDTATTDEDVALNDINVLGNDDDIDGDSLSVTNVTDPAHGSAEVVDGKVNYKPADNYNGPDSFTYTVSDGNGETATATVNVTVTPVNDVPSVGDITGASSAIEGESKTYTVTGTDDDGDTLTYAWTVKSGAANANITSGAATHTATVKFLDGPGSVNLQVVVSDGHGGQVTKNLDSNLISVTNVDPDITSFTSTPYFFGPLSFLGNTPNASKFSGAWTDPGADTWTAQLDYQDGTPLTQTLGPLTARLFSDQGHTFASAGCKSTSLKVADDDTGFDTATTTTNVGTGAFMPPMTNQPVTDKLKNGQVLPVKVKFTDCSGAPLTNLTPAIRLVQGDQTPASDDSTAAITPGSVSAADTLGIMRSNGDGSYIYNMSVNITLNKDYTVMVYPYGTNDPRKLAHVIQATK